MARLPLASRQDILDELAEIAAARDGIRGDACPERAAERREGLDRWERDLREQLAEMDEKAPV